MSTDPLGEALGAGESPVTPPGQPGAPSKASVPPPPSQPATGYQAPPTYEAPSAYDPQPSQPAWGEPEPERSLLERRPEILVGAAMAGGFLAAQVLGRIRRR